jgi:putative membrane protein
MMYWGTGDWNWAAWLAMTVSMVAFWGLIASAIISLARRPTRHGPTAEQILDERFASGDIDDDEYRRRQSTLRSRGG